VAGLFSALVNMQDSESVMGRTESLTLVDRIHPRSISLQALCNRIFRDKQQKQGKQSRQSG
jgi:hypothetical protein